MSLYLGCITIQRSIPFGHGLHLLVWDHQGCGLESSQLKKLVEWETSCEITQTLGFKAIINPLNTRIKSLRATPPNEIFTGDFAS
jgi:hypothetical protein